MKYDGENIKRTDMTTYAHGRNRIVYKNNEGKLFYKLGGHLIRTFEEYCNR